MTEDRDLPDVGFGRVSAHHALRVEIITDLADRLLHHEYPASPVLIIKGQNDLAELSTPLPTRSSKRSFRAQLERTQRGSLEIGAR
jgi:hypothetical protein